MKLVHFIDHLDFRKAAFGSKHIKTYKQLSVVCLFYHLVLNKWFRFRVSACLYTVSYNVSFKGNNYTTAA